MLTDKTPQQIMDDLRKRLAGAKGQWRKLSAATGVPRDTLVKISDGRTGNPRLETVIPLMRALEFYEATGNFYGRRPPKKAVQPQVNRETLGA